MFSPSRVFSPASRLIALALLVAATGCGRRETETTRAARAQILLTCAGGEPSELDPHIINAPPDYVIVLSLFEGLLTGDPQTLEPRPGVAERWENTADGLTYTFHLRDNAKWSNGDPVTAADFVYSFQRALSPALGSQYTFLFDAVVGATAFAHGDSRDFSTVGVSAPDPRTVKIQLTRPVAFFTSMVANNPIWYPVHRATIEKFGRIDQRGTGWTRSENFVGNGAFVLRHWLPGQRIEMERSPHYWNASHIALRGITFFAIDNYEAEERSFRAGQLHATLSLPPSRLPYYREKEPGLLRERPVLTDIFLNVNTARPPLSDPRVRRALSQALPRTALIKRALFGGGTPALQIVPPGLPGYHSPPALEENLDAARAELAAAGFPGGRGFPVLELAYDATTGAQFTQVMQESWRHNLGINVTLASVETRVLWSNLQSRNYTLSIGGWAGDYLDATSFLELFRSGGGWNFTQWGDSTYDRLLDRAASELGPTERQKILAEAEAKLQAAMPIIPIYFQNRSSLVDPAVKNWPMNVCDRRYFNDVSLATP